MPEPAVVRRAAALRAASRARQGDDHQHLHRRELPGDVQPRGAEARAGQQLRRGRHPGPGHPAGAVRPRQGAHAVDGAVLRHLRDRRGRAQPTPRRSSRLLDKDPQTLAPPVLLFSLGRLRSSSASWSTPASGSRCSCATAPRCAPRCRSGCRSTCGWTCEIQQGLFFGSPTVSAAVERGRRRGDRHLHARVHIIGAGETLSGLAARLPGRSRAVAATSPRPTSIDDPFDLRSGTLAGHPARGAEHVERAGHAVTEPFYAPRFEIRLSGVTMAADVDRPGRQPDRRDRPRPRRARSASSCATPTTRCSTRRCSTSARPSRSTWATAPT